MTSCIDSCSIYIRMMTTLLTPHTGSSAQGEGGGGTPSSCRGACSGASAQGGGAQGQIRGLQEKGVWADGQERGGLEGVSTRTRQVL